MITGDSCKNCGEIVIQRPNDGVWVHYPSLQPACYRILYAEPYISAFRTSVQQSD
jgi:hypothetical protein